MQSSNGVGKQRDRPGGAAGGAVGPAALGATVPSAYHGFAHPGLQGWGQRTVGAPAAQDLCLSVTGH